MVLLLVSSYNSLLWQSVVLQYYRGQGENERIMVETQAGFAGVCAGQQAIGHL
jgi:hypothetical protein